MVTSIYKRTHKRGTNSGHLKNYAKPSSKSSKNLVRVLPAQFILSEACS